MTMGETMTYISARQARRSGCRPAESSNLHAPGLLPCDWGMVYHGVLDLLNKVSTSINKPLQGHQY